MYDLSEDSGETWRYILYRCIDCGDVIFDKVHRGDNYTPAWQCWDKNCNSGRNSKSPTEMIYNSQGMRPLGELTYEELTLYRQDRNKFISQLPPMN